MTPNIIAALISFLGPVIVLVIPGLTITRRLYSALTVLWSLAILIIFSLVFALLGLPLYLISIIAVLFLLTPLFSKHYRWPHKKYIVYSLLTIVIFLGLYIAFSVPFLTYHHGLPTGDSQKTIYWANQIIANQSLPDYQTSLSQLNRDPVDFYTPGLHSFAALIMQLSLFPLITIGFLSISLSLAIAAIGAHLAHKIFNTSSSLVIPLLSVIFILTNIRFLRYLREPGYHFQNIIGELLLMGLLFLIISLTKRWHWPTAILFVLVSICLLFTHQFSSFLGFFIITPAIIVLGFNYRQGLKDKIITHKKISLGVVLLAAITIAFAVIQDLHQKIPHIFTLKPHLLSLTPDLSDYFRLMGAFWFASGVAGLLLGLFHINKQKGTALYGQLAFFSSTIALLIMSQAPRIFIDIPPVRALFYCVVPLSILAAYFYSELFRYFRHHLSPVFKYLAITIVVLLIIAATYSALGQAFTLSHSIRTNSTLTPEQQWLTNYLKENKAGGLLIDDYNRRSSSWLLLGGQPTFSRISADLARQMNEAEQSNKRSQLYLKQLDYEKIFSLGSLPEIETLLSKHSISWLTGVHKSSDFAFQHNPLLVEAARADDITLFSLSPKSQTELSTTARWLLRSSTLANDIGDPEDTWLHLPASLRSTRLSDPKVINQTTFRTTNAPLIPLFFNVGDYTTILWDQEKTGYPDTSVELLVQATTDEWPLIVHTPTNKELHFTKNNPIIKIPARDVPINDQGFIIFTISNATEAIISFDLIALGLAKTP